MRESGIKGKLSTKGANTLYDVMIRAEVGKRRGLVFEIPFEILEDGASLLAYTGRAGVCPTRVCVQGNCVKSYDIQCKPA